MKAGMPVHGHVYRYADAQQVPEEEWRHVRDFPQYYVSSLGKVKVATGRVRKVVMLDGVAVLKSGSLRMEVAPLVAHAFVASPTPHVTGVTWVVRHKDGDTGNNRADNLE